jgi:hypothetical protein
VAPADEVWKSASLARTFLDGVRGGIPFAATHIDLMLRILSATGVAWEEGPLGCPRQEALRWTNNPVEQQHLRRKLRELE